MSFYKHVVFDLDGTLVDSLPDIGGSINTILEREGHPSHPIADYASWVGWGLKRTLELALPSPEFLESLYPALLEEYMRRPYRDSQVYSGVIELLCSLQNLGVTTTIWTAKNESIAQAVVSALLPQFSGTVVGQREGQPAKPSPELVFEAWGADRSAQKPILMVGDTVTDLKSAQAIEAEFAGALWGYRSRKELESAGSQNNFTTPMHLCRQYFGGTQ
ncbi:MAG: HAD family hydrolase [Spirochaetales bacterium]|nr:HAD family hydrolase [Spirochaetales bacterium]